jgi:hypothetical protein
MFKSAQTHHTRKSLKKAFTQKHHRMRLRNNKQITNENQVTTTNHEYNLRKRTRSIMNDNEYSFSMFALYINAGKKRRLNDISSNKKDTSSAIEEENKLLCEEEDEVIVEKECIEMEQDIMCNTMKKVQFEEIVEQIVEQKQCMKPTNIDLSLIMDEQEAEEEKRNQLNELTPSIGSSTPKSPAFSYKTLMDAGDVGYYAELHRSQEDDFADVGGGFGSSDDEEEAVQLPASQETSSQEISDAGSSNTPETVTSPVVYQSPRKNKPQHHFREDPVTPPSRRTAVVPQYEKMRTRHQERIHWIYAVKEHCMSQLGLSIPANGVQLGVNSTHSSPHQRRQQRSIASQFSPQKLAGKYQGLPLPDNIIYFLKFLKWDNSVPLCHNSLGLTNIEFNQIVLNIDQRYDIMYLYKNDDAMIIGKCSEGYLVTHIAQSVDQYLKRLAPGLSLRTRMQNNLSFLREDFDFDFPVFLVRFDTKQVEGPIMIMDFLQGATNSNNTRTVTG